MEARISILTFPQRIENNRLFFNVLVIPRNHNPLVSEPVQGLSPAWIKAKLRLQACLLPSLTDYPRLDLPAVKTVLPIMPVLPEATTIFKQLAAQFDISSTATAEPPAPNHFARKYLPNSYREAFNFTKPRTNRAAIDDSYACAIGKEKEIDPLFKPDNDQVSWGQVFGFCLRQPAIARKCGFIQEGFIDLTPGQLANGGWLYVDFVPGSNYHNAVDLSFAKRYAARLPKVAAGTNRRLFAPVLFPVRHDLGALPDNPEAPAAALYDELLLEAGIYDDGFTKIIHAHQPVSDHLLKETPDAEYPVTNDAGIRLAWDDEQLLIWMNRQMEEDSAKPGRRVDAPMGVFGYRVDARVFNGDPDNPNPWVSLCQVQNRVNLALGAAEIAPAGAQQELNVEVYPAIPDGRKNHFWLPAYFAYWTGKSLVLQDDDAIDIYKKDQNELNGNQQVSKNGMYDPIGLDGIPLLYGRTYEFRTRLADMTGGGPPAAEQHIYDAEAPIARHSFKRYAIPQTVRLQNILPENDGDYLQDNQLTVQRPLLGYPSVLFTGAYPNAVDLLKADFAGAAGKRDIGIADPDVDRLEIEVAVRALDMDTTVLKKNPKDQYAILYKTNRAFPAGFDDALSVPFTFVDRPVLHFNGSPNLALLGLSDNNDLIDDMPDLVLPTHRDIQITIRAVCREQNDYYGKGTSISGMQTQFLIRRAATTEADIFKATSELTRIRGIYLRRPQEQKVTAQVKHVFFGAVAQPDQQPELIDRLSTSIDVEHKGMSLLGKPGQRWQFGAGRAIRHTLAPDNTSLTFATKDDLINHWLVPITLLLNRDWSWDGAEPVSIDIFRRKKFLQAADWEPETLIGDIELKKAVNIQALTNADRTQTFLCFIDAVAPQSDDPALFPDEILLEYRIVPNFRTDNPALIKDDPLLLSLHLPITTIPAQMPTVVSAGVAMSRYVRDADYANTEVRQRYLWVEFDKQADNPRDAYFGRITAYAPDPLLAQWTEDWMVPRLEPALSIDPEPVRIISPGHSDNQAGLNAMQQLIPATDSKRHFLVPLPPGLHPESPELFGFFTYEFRVGHRESWSTAQGRFGRALACQGVQHPMPQLIGVPDRDEKRIRVSAAHAEAVFDGRRVTARPVRTQLWALLYAQARMADNSDNRNILLNDRLMRTESNSIINADGRILLFPKNTDEPERATAEWSNAEITELLKMYGLPADSELSVLCVEMMPTTEQFLMSPEQNKLTQALTQRTNDPASALFSLRATASAITQKRVPDVPEELLARPLSDDLGYYRILRTSTLMAVPEVCCMDC